jgi:hypothetical protein
MNDLEALQRLVGHAFSSCRLDFLRWALPQCRTDEQHKMAAAIARAIGDVSYAEAQAAFSREIAKASSDNGAV